MDRGVKAVRMDDIASRLAISKRTIYELFSDKRQLVGEALRYISEKKSGENFECFAGSGNIVDELVRMLRWWEDSAGSISRFVQDVRMFYPDIYERFSDEHSSTAIGIFREKLHKGVREGFLLEGLDVELTLYVVTNSVDTLAFGEKSTLPEGVSRQDVFRYIVVYFFRGITTEKGRKIIDEYINGK